MTAPAPKCDVCGEPATMECIDVFRHEVPGHHTVEYSPSGYLKRGCDKHPVKSVEHVTHLPRDMKGPK